MKNLLPLAALLGCAGPQIARPKIASGGFMVDKESVDRAFEDIRSRASFEMDCPGAQLQFTVLFLAYGTSFPEQIGASGCNKKAVYVRIPSGWVMNTQSETKK